MQAGKDLPLTDPAEDTNLMIKSLQVDPFIPLDLDIQ